MNQARLHRIAAVRPAPRKLGDNFRRRVVVEVGSGCHHHHNLRQLCS